MGRLIDDLLNFSRLGRADLCREMVNMNEIVLEVRNEFQEQAAKVIVRCGALPPCWGDRALLKQVWVNLLSNAFKYTGKKPNPDVEIDAMRVDGKTVYFVRDNGTGFDMRYADKLFGVFQRLHRAEEYEGTGVGLAIVQRIILRHGGRIWAEAAPNQGATFFFTLGTPP